MKQSLHSQNVIIVTFCNTKQYNDCLLRNSHFTIFDYVYKSYFVKSFSPKLNVQCIISLHNSPLTFFEFMIYDTDEYMRSYIQLEIQDYTYGLVCKALEMEV